MGTANGLITQEVPISSSPAIGSDGTIYFGDRNGKLYAITDNITSGSLKWFYATGGSILMSSPLHRQ